MKKSDINLDSYQILAFYAFTPLSNKDMYVLSNNIKNISTMNNIKGTVLIALEGVNGTICGKAFEAEKVIKEIESYLPLNCLDIKISWSNKQAFKRLRVRQKKEIVTIGIPDVNPRELVGKYVEPTNWNELISDPNTLVIDTRNEYEIGIGTFTGAINPHTRNFRDFPKWVKTKLPQIIKEKSTKRIAMFCTGGIRCEKATSLLKKEGFNDVHHLQGGILRYLKEIPEDQSQWIGECFVFDQRVSLNHELKPGIHSMCHACGSPLNPEDMKGENYIKGIQCHKCINKYTDKDRFRFAERQRQIDNQKEINPEI